MRIPSFKHCLLASVIAGLAACGGDNNKGQNNGDNLVTVTQQELFSPVVAAILPVVENESAGEVSITATVSVKSGGDPIQSYLWTQTSGPDVTLLGADTPTLRFESPRVTEATELVFSFVANNGEDSDPVDVTVTINNVATAPTANAGADFAVNEGTPDVALAGSASVEFGDQLPVDSYSWTQTGGPSVTLSDASTADPTFTAPDVDADTNLTFSLIADNGIASVADTVVVSVNNLVPIADAGGDAGVIEVTEGESFTLDGSDSLQNGDSLIVSYTWRSVGGAFTVDNSDVTSSARSFSALRVDGDAAFTEYQFGLIVVDASDTSSAEDIVTVRVNNGGAVPTAATVGDGVAQGAQNTAITIDAEPSSDPADRALTYTWVQSLADGEVAVEVTTAEDGRQLVVSAPEVDEDVELTFSLTVDNGVNVSAAHTVTLTVISQETYLGDIVELKGNPFSILNDQLDLSAYGELYDMVLIDTNAYITYHDMKAVAEGKATGVLVVDVSDDENLTVTDNYVLPFSDPTSTSQTLELQLNLAVDPTETFAYVVDSQIVDADNLNRLARIDLSVDSSGDASYVEYYTFVEDSGIEEVADVVVRNGSVYLAAAGTRSLYRLDPASDPATPDITRLWFDTPSTGPEFFGVDEIDGGRYESLEMMDDGDGSVAVFYNGDSMQVVRLDAIDTVVTVYKVRSHGNDLVRLGSGGDPLDFRKFNGLDSQGSDSERVASFSIDESTDYAYVAFSQDGSGNRPLRRYSALERVDIRDPALIVDPDAIDTEGVYFQTKEDAFEVLRAGGRTYVGGGIQGLQVIDDVVGADPTLDSFELATYYQTPVRAEDLAVSDDLTRAYVIGDRSLMVIDLDSSVQGTPAQATDWVGDYVAGVVVQADKGDSGLDTEGNMPGRATDVEIVEFRDELGVLLSEYAVVAQSSDPDGDDFDGNSNNLYIFDIDGDTIDPVKVDVSAFGLDADEVEQDIQLHQAYGNIYIGGALNNDPDGVLRLASEQVREASPVLGVYSTGAAIASFDFYSEDNAFISSSNNSLEYWSWSDDIGEAAQSTAASTSEEIWNSTFYDNMFLSGNRTHVVGSGSPNGSDGCALFSLFRDDGDPSFGSTAPNFVFDIIDYNRVDNEFANASFYSGASDIDREICFGGFGFEQTSVYDEVEADNELGSTERQTVYGIQTVQFTTPIDSLLETDDSLTN
ncbi:MAG: hypothetical protein ACI9VI_003097, partial [Candidatus Azotimanducaceae bacterium]